MSIQLCTTKLAGKVVYITNDAGLSVILFNMINLLIFYSILQESPSCIL